MLLRVVVVPVERVVVAGRCVAVVADDPLVEVAAELSTVVRGRVLITSVRLPDDC